MLELAATRTECASAPVDGVISAWATRQYGVISRAQLRAVGLSDGGISARVARGGLIRVHHGVYAVGHTVLTAGGDGWRPC
jgi:hypothetical protein